MVMRISDEIHDKNCLQALDLWKKGEWYHRKKGVEERFPFDSPASFIMVHTMRTVQTFRMRMNALPPAMDKIFNASNSNDGPRHDLSTIMPPDDDKSREECSDESSSSPLLTRCIRRASSRSRHMVGVPPPPQGPHGGEQALRAELAS